MLLYYLSVARFDEFKKDDLKNYERFIDIIRSFQTWYKLEKFSLKEIDVFLWLVGKEYFPRNYKRGITERDTADAKAAAG
jgi:hypothetical protein